MVFVYVMSLGQTSLQALKRVSTLSIPKGISHKQQFTPFNTHNL